MKGGPQEAPGLSLGGVGCTSPLKQIEWKWEGVRGSEEEEEDNQMNVLLSIFPYKFLKYHIFQNNKIEEG
jgi:hypothetical protein